MVARHLQAPYYVGHKERIRIHVGHGRNSDDQDDHVPKVMGTQCKLNKRDFSRFIYCPLGQADYEKTVGEHPA